MSETDFSKKMDEAKIIYHCFKEADECWKNYLNVGNFFFEMEDDILGRTEVFDAITNMVKNRYKKIAFRSHLYAFGGMIDIKKCYKDFDTVYHNLKEVEHITGNVMKEAACYILHEFVGDDIKNMILVIDECVDPHNCLELQYWFKRAKSRSKENKYVRVNKKKAT